MWETHVTKGLSAESHLLSPSKKKESLGLIHIRLLVLNLLHIWLCTSHLSLLDESAVILDLTETSLERIIHTILNKVLRMKERDKRKSSLILNKMEHHHLHRHTIWNKIFTIKKVDKIIIIIIINNKYENNHPYNPQQDARQPQCPACLRGSHVHPVLARVRQHPCENYPGLQKKGTHKKFICTVSRISKKCSSRNYKKDFCFVYALG